MGWQAPVAKSTRNALTRARFRTVPEQRTHSTPARHCSRALSAKKAQCVVSLITPNSAGVRRDSWKVAYSGAWSNARPHLDHGRQCRISSVACCVPERREPLYFHKARS